MLLRKIMKRNNINNMITFAYIKYYLYLCAQFAKKTFFDKFETHNFIILFINFQHIFYKLETHFYKLYIQLQQ